MKGQTTGATVYTLPVDGVKNCIKCGHAKALVAFMPGTKCLDGRRNVCRDCYNGQRRGNPASAAWRKKYSSTVEGRFNKAKWLAHERGYEFSLSIEQYSAIVVQPCHYCHDAFGERVKLGVGLDRLHNSIGYAIGNVVSCCGRCNRLKSDWMTPAEALAAVEAILRVRGLK